MIKIANDQDMYVSPRPVPIINGRINFEHHIAFPIGAMKDTDSLIYTLFAGREEVDTLFRYSIYKEMVDPDGVFRHTQTIDVPYSTEEESVPLMFKMDVFEKKGKKRFTPPL